MLSTVKNPTNKMSVLTGAVTTLGMVFVVRALMLLGSQTSGHLLQLIDISVLFLIMAPWSVQLPSGAMWRPAMPLVMLSIFILPPLLTVLVAIPGLILNTARARAAWWKYPQTFAHVGLGLYAGASVYRTIIHFAGHNPAPTFLAMLAGVIVHLLVNRGISVLIVAERTGRSLGAQIGLSLRELHLGYLNSYLIILMAGLLYPYYGMVTYLLAGVAQVGLMQAVFYYSSVRQLEQAASVDGLTGVENRSSWEKFAHDSEKNPIPGHVIVIDVDGFKSINDQFGHIVGDGVMRDLAQAISRRLPKRARMFRYGGDEFVVFDGRSDLDEVLTSISGAVTMCNQDWESKGVTLGVSVGHSTSPTDGTRLAELFSIADARMYEEKHRHRIAVDGMEVSISETVLGLIAATETRDKYTAGHNLRVAFYALELAKHFRLESQKLKAIFRGSMVHDIGKIGIPDALLSKPGMLTLEERKIVETHPQIGFDMCAQLGFSTDELAVILYHHEKWDGSGYPRGMKQEEIPLVSRIVALADIYDALTSDRAYRKSWSHEEVMKYITDNAGVLFDPACVDAWLVSNENVPLINRQPAWIREGGVARAMARMAAN